MRNVLQVKFRKIHLFEFPHSARYSQVTLSILQKFCLSVTPFCPIKTKQVGILTKSGNGDIGLGLGNKVKDRVTVRVRNQGQGQVQSQGLRFEIGLGYEVVTGVVLTWMMIKSVNLQCLLETILLLLYSTFNDLEWPYHTLLHKCRRLLYASSRAHHKNLKEDRHFVHILM